MNRPFVAPLPGLAPRTVRLAAVFVDALVAVPVLLVWSVAAASSLGLTFGAFASFAQKRPWLSQAGSVLAGTAAWAVFAVASVVLGCLVLFQWYLLSTRGQTIGKRLMGIRVVDLEGKPVGFFTALLVRAWVFYGLVSVVVGFAGVVIPFAGLFVWLLDYVPLMGEDRRCVHDYLAGTQVRWVRVVEVYVGRIVGAVAGVAVVGVSVWGVMNREAVGPFIESLGRARPEPVAIAPVPSVPTLLPVPSAPTLVPVVVAPQVVPVALVPEPPKPEPIVEVEKKLYQFTDDQGVVHITDELASVPPKFRNKVTTRSSE
jgi:uncharacterized RDD family membrane protein YckC